MQGLDRGSKRSLRAGSLGASLMRFNSYLEFCAL